MKFSEPPVKYSFLYGYQKKELQQPSVELENCTSTLTNCSLCPDFCLAETFREAVVAVAEGVVAVAVGVDLVEEGVVDSVDEEVVVDLEEEEAGVDLVEEEAVVDLVEEEVVVGLVGEEVVVDLVEEAVLEEVAEGLPVVNFSNGNVSPCIISKKVNKQSKILYGYLTWEWHEQLRSIIFPGIFAVIYKVLYYLNLDFALFLVLVPRVCCAVLMASSDVAALKLAQKLYGKSVRGSVTLCLASCWFLEYCASRTISGVPETAITMWALTTYPWALHSDPGSNPAADMVDAARNTAWDLGKQPNNYRSNYPTQEWARRWVVSVLSVVGGFGVCTTPHCRRAVCAPLCCTTLLLQTQAPATVQSCCCYVSVMQRLLQLLCVTAAAVT
ncbi:GPI mannosyltransferase [Trinorchestia longiramus]|nr:GPI mannosyltransferase [Trinorchestia longiramus]